MRKKENPLQILLLREQKNNLNMELGLNSKLQKFFAILLELSPNVKAFIEK